MNENDDEITGPLTGLKVLELGNLEFENFGA